MSSTGIDKVLILNEGGKASRVVEDFIRKSLKHPHEIVWSDLKEKGRGLARKGDFGLLVVDADITSSEAYSACKIAIAHPTACILFLATETEMTTPEEKKAQTALLDLGAAILIKPLKQSAFAAAINSADMAHIRLCALKKKLDDEKVVTRAKLLLMQSLGLSEEEAHKFIEKKAMNTGRTKFDVAFEIVQTYEEK
ncbi:MAG: ANTAR domain-containing protein [Clostridiales bacterium]|nr:ANTAR domain-containing protein [Clostridiales bacterium]